MAGKAVHAPTGWRMLSHLPLAQSSEVQSNDAFSTIEHSLSAGSVAGSGVISH
jgi:hypothetical protein